MSAAKLADKLFFRFGGQPPSGGLSVRSQFTEARDGATQPRAQLGQVSHLRGVFLRGGHGQVGKVKTRPVLVQGWDDVGNGSLLGVEEVGGKGQSREREARVYEALRRRHLGDGGPGDRSSQHLFLEGNSNFSLDEISRYNRKSPLLKSGVPQSGLWRSQLA